MGGRGIKILRLSKLKISWRPISIKYAFWIVSLQSVSIMPSVPCNTVELLQRPWERVRKQGWALPQRQISSLFWVSILSWVKQMISKVFSRSENKFLGIYPHSSSHVTPHIISPQSTFPEQYLPSRSHQHAACLPTGNLVG